MTEERLREIELWSMGKPMPQELCRALRSERERVKLLEDYVDAVTDHLDRAVCEDDWKANKETEELLDEGIRLLLWDNALRF